MSDFKRKLFNFLKGPGGATGSPKIQARTVDAMAAVRVFYCISFYVFCKKLYFFLNQDVFPQLEYATGWVDRLFHGVDSHRLVLLTYSPAALFLLLSAIWPKPLLNRTAAFLGLFLIGAIENAMLIPNISESNYFWVAFIFIFLPRLNERSKFNRENFMKYLTVCRAAVFVVASSYFLSGTWKIIDGLIRPLAGGQGGFLTAGGFTQHLFAYSAKNGHTPYALGFTDQLGWLGPVLLLTVIYFQTVSIFVPFRPHLVKLWCFFFGVFHLASIVLMNISFNEMGFLTVALVMLMPFGKVESTARNTVRSMPLFGLLLGKSSKN